MSLQKQKESKRRESKRRKRDVSDWIEIKNDGPKREKRAEEVQQKQREEKKLKEQFQPIEDWMRCPPLVKQQQIQTKWGKRANIGRNRKRTLRNFTHYIGPGMKGSYSLTGLLEELYCVVGLPFEDVPQLKKEEKRNGGEHRKVRLAKLVGDIAIQPI